MRFSHSIAVALVLLSCLATTGFGDLVVGTISNFQDGTVQGWSGGTVSNIANSGPLGVGDHSLQLANGGVAQNFAMFNTGVNGSISPAVNAITSDILRPSGTGAAEIRLVLFDTAGTRWTSTIAANVVDNGLWNNYTFPIFEANLTQVFGTGTYADLVAGLERIMFRYDPGAPSGTGASLNGTMNFDNITAIPEPSAILALVTGGLAFVFGQRRARIG